MGNSGVNITIAIPISPGRTEQGVEVVRAWQKAGVQVSVYCWGDETYKALTRKRTWEQRFKDSLFKTHEATVDVLWLGERKSYAQVQNFMAKEIDGWDVLICGADDCWPDKGTELIGKAAKEVPEAILWAADGLFNQQPTHPIITRGWYDKYRQIFDEGFYHNFCDTDLMVRTSREHEIVDCRSFITFDHRHPLGTGAKKDSLYKWADSMFRNDKIYFDLKHMGRGPLPPIRTLEIEEAA